MNFQHLCWHFKMNLSYKVHGAITLPQYIMQSERDINTLGDNEAFTQKTKAMFFINFHRRKSTDTDNYRYSFKKYFFLNLQSVIMIRNNTIAEIQVLHARVEAETGNSANSHDFLNKGTAKRT